MGDFNGDGVADILWRNTVSALVALWRLTAGAGGTASIAATDVVATGVTSHWSTVWARDFDGSAHADLFWRNEDGEVAIWLTNGPFVMTSTFLGPVTLDWSSR